MGMYFDTSKLEASLMKCLEKECVQAAAKVIIANIENQTEVGRDAEGKIFVPYKPEYAKIRKAAGKRIDRVNLRMQDESSLLDTLHFDKSEVKVTVDTDHAPIAHGLMKKRKFLAVGKQDIPMIEKAVGLAIEKAFGTA